MGSDSALEGRSLRILVVEDEFLVADHLAISLEDLGYEVVGPYPAIDEALLAVRDETLDGAVLDANLDGIDSGPIAAELAARNVPFIVLTGYGGLRLECEILDGAPRVTKPFDLAELATILSDTIGARGELPTEG